MRNTPGIRCMEQWTNKDVIVPVNALLPELISERYLTHNLMYYAISHGMYNPAWINTARTARLISGSSWPSRLAFLPPVVASHFTFPVKALFPRRTGSNPS